MLRQALGANRPETPSEARGLRLVLGVSFMVFAVYQFTMLLIPFYALQVGYRELAAGGLTTAFMLGATVGPLLGRPLLGRGRLGRTLGWSLALHALATLAMGMGDSLGLLLAMSVVRGVTFGLLAAGLAVAVVLEVPGDRRSSALGVWGMVCTAPAVLAPTAAVTAAEHVDLLVLMAGAAALTALTIWPLSKLGLDRAAAKAEDPIDVAVATEAQRMPFWRPLGRTTGIFFVASAAYGAVVSFAPAYIVAERSVASSAAFLLSMGIMVSLGRLVGGARLSQVHSAIALPTGFMLAIAGLLTMLIAHAVPLLVLAGAAYGLGWGTIGTMCQIAMLRQAGSHRTEHASVAFSIAFNAGIATGGITMGALAEKIGMGDGFLVFVFASLLAVPFSMQIGRDRSSRAGGTAATA
jgi:predicted MFS family arabinose efflux permease